MAPQPGIPPHGDRPHLDSLDADLIAELAARPRQGLLETSRRLRVARGTVQARLARLLSTGVVTGFGPDVDVARLGYPVQGFVSLEVDQADRQELAVALARVPEVLEAHTVTGAADLLVRVAARSNAELQVVLDALVALPGVRRSASVLALATPVPYRVLPLVAAATRGHRAAPPR